LPYIHIDGKEVGLNNPLPAQLSANATTEIGLVGNISKTETILSSDARTVSGNSLEFDISKFKEALVFLDITSSSGTTPTLDVKFQTQDPVSLKWFDLTELTFTQKTTLGSEMKKTNGLLGNKVRCSYTIAGTTPIFTFSVGMVLKS
jgi:hypothetical protein